MLAASNWSSVSMDDFEHAAAAAVAPAPVPAKSAPAKSGGKSGAAKSAPAAAAPEEDDKPQIRTLIKKGRAPLDPCVGVLCFAPRFIHQARACIAQVSARAFEVNARVRIWRGCL